MCTACSSPTAILKFNPDKGKPVRKSGTQSHRSKANAMTAGLPKEELQMNLLSRESFFEIYRSIIEYNPDAIFILSIDGKVIEVNQAVTIMFGYLKEEVQGCSYKKMMFPELEKINRYFDEVLQGISSEFETDAFHKSGSILHIRVKFIPLIIGVEVVGVCCVIKDVTELQKMKAFLSEMEQRVKALFNSTGDAIDVLDLEGNVLDVNPAFEEMYGWKREEVIGKLLPIIPEYQLAEAQSLVEKAKLGENITGFESICIKKDGTPIDVSLTLSPIRDSKGNIIAISGITRDISGQKRLERSLKESEERYKSLFEYNINMIYSIDLNECFIDGNPSFEQVTGYSVDELRGTSLVPLIVPEYLEVMKESFKKAVQGETQRYECFIYNKEGRMIPLMVTNVPIIVNNEIVGVYCIALDLSDVRKAEKALEESEERYRKVVELSPMGIVVQQKGKILYANRAALKSMKEENLIGQSIFSYIHPNYHELVKQRVAEAEIGEEFFFTEMQFIQRDGTIIDVEVGGVLMIYNGSPATLIMFRDITKENVLKES